jgi:hypothetical protein
MIELAISRCTVHPIVAFVAGSILPLLDSEAISEWAQPFTCIDTAVWECGRRQLYSLLSTRVVLSVRNLPSWGSISGSQVMLRVFCLHFIRKYLTNKHIPAIWLLWERRINMPKSCHSFLLVCIHCLLRIVQLPIGMSRPALSLCKGVLIFIKILLGVSDRVFRYRLLLIILIVFRVSHWEPSCPTHHADLILINGTAIACLSAIQVPHSKSYFLHRLNLFH